MIKPPSDILRALKEGNVSTWNAWKEKQEGVVDLRLANLQWADLTGVDLTGAYLQWADLRGALLRLANLQGADLQGADLRGVNLQGANLRGTGLSYRWLRYRCIITPSHAWFGCKEGSHDYWESLSKEDALALDSNAHLLWEHRDELLQLMKQCREKGWPQ